MNNVTKSHKTIFMLITAASLLCICIGVLIVYLMHRGAAKAALFQAIKDNDYNMACNIVEKYPSLVNENRWEPDLVAKLCDAISQPPLLMACAYGEDRKEFIELFVENGADINKCGNTVHTYPILRALKQGDIDIAQYLIDKGADLLVSDYYYENVPYAAANINADIGDVEIQDRCLDVLNSAVAKGAPIVPQRGDCYYYENAGVTSVFGIAASSNQASIVKYFLENGIYGIDEIVHIENKTALMLAAENDAYDVATLLISLGADRTIADTRGMTAYDYAIVSENKVMAELLK